MSLFKKFDCPECGRRLKKSHAASLTTPLYVCWKCKKVWLDTELVTGNYEPGSRACIEEDEYRYDCPCNKR